MSHLAGIFQSTNFHLVQMPSGTEAFTVVTNSQLLYFAADVLQLKYLTRLVVGKVSK